jgi:hypothetical protein
VRYDLDTVIVIYAVEGNPADQQRALNHLAALEQAGHRFAIGELTRTEHLVPVFGPGSGERQSRPLSRGDTGWPMPSISPPPSSPAVTCS